MANANSKITLYTADFVLPIVGQHIKGGAVAVKNGKILHVGDRKWVLEQLAERSLAHEEQRYQGVLMPGLINAHTHLQYTCMAEVASRHYSGFDDWSAAFDAVYNSRPHNWAAAAVSGARQSLAAGVTAVADVVTDAAALSALHDAGMHGITYWEVYGHGNDDWGVTQRETVSRQLAQIPTPPLAGLSPHAPYSLAVRPLLELPDIAREQGLRLHIHLAEAHMERTMRTNNATLEQLAIDNFRQMRSQGIGVSSTMFVDRLGVLGPDCHVAHGVYVDAADRALLRARGTSVALCPRSNTVIGLDMPPIAAYLREGNQIAVGTDSLASSPSLDPLADVALLYDIAREQGYHEADLHDRLLHAVTLGGAVALGQQVGNERIGQLAVGATADFAVFDIAQRELREAVAELVEAGAGKCSHTIIAGREVSRADAAV
ncbi:amidohydrolase family protein [Canibacter sp. lx-72]|uniref:amidohydrolase family protein n=1 Tax=Canibacter zhuwentaonis TaxID=2837491 RepID=UPI001BDC5494|nr:amidohydrolase family protein [Canibacter zhuwentaonis]